MQFDWSAIWPAIPILLEGAKMTLWISVLGLTCVRNAERP